MKITKTINVRTKEITKHYCDRCNTQLHDRNTGSFYALSSLNGEIHYESWMVGEYCTACIEIFARVFDEAMDNAGFVERYEKAKCSVESEVSMINTQIAKDDEESL